MIRVVAKKNKRKIIKDHYLIVPLITSFWGFFEKMFLSRWWCGGASWYLVTQPRDKRTGRANPFRFHPLLTTLYDQYVSWQRVALRRVYSTLTSYSLKASWFLLLMVVVRIITIHLVRANTRRCGDRKCIHVIEFCRKNPTTTIFCHTEVDVQSSQSHTAKCRVVDAVR